MAYTQRDGYGVLFKNQKKDQPQHADYKGSATVGGVEYWLNGWLKDGAKNKFMSLSIQPKVSYGAKPETTLADEMGGEEVPF